jgi:chorismate mutase
MADRPLLVRGIRGATVAEQNDAEAILKATEELLLEITRVNDLKLDFVASALFTVTPDLTAAFPAAAARRLGWHLVPLLNFTEIGVQGGLQRCIRVLIHVNTAASQTEICHVYLGEARSLRPDLPPSTLETAP